MRTLDDDDEETVTKGRSQTTTQQPAWMRALLANCREWLSALPSVWKIPIVLNIYSDHKQGITKLPRQSTESHDPLYRFFMRETLVGTKLLRQVRRDLQDLIQVCQGELKQTNHLRSLMSNLAKGLSFFIY